MPVITTLSAFESCSSSTLSINPYTYASGILIGILTLTVVLSGLLGQWTYFTTIFILSETEWCHKLNRDFDRGPMKAHHRKNLCLPPLPCTPYVATSSV